MTITYGCGHKEDLDETRMPDRPICPKCGDHRVTHVNVRPPTFRGAATGPLVTTHG